MTYGRFEQRSSSRALARAFVEFFGVDSPLLKVIDGIGGRLKKLGGFIAGVGGGLAAAGGAVSAPLTKLFTDAAKRGRDVEVMAKQFHSSTQELSALGAGFEQAGGSFEEFSGMLDGLSQRILNDDELLRNMRVNTLGLRQAHASIGTVLEVVADQFASLTDEQKKAEIASQVFGARWRELMPYLNDGAAGIRRLREEGKEFAMDPEQARRSTEVMKGLNQIWAQLKLTLLDVGAALLPTREQIREVVTWIKSAGSNVLEWIRENKELIKTVFLVASGVALVGTALTLVGGTIAAVGAGVAGFVFLLKGLLAVLSGILLPLAVIGGAGYLWASFTESGKNAVATIKGAFGDLVGTVKESWSGISAAMKSGDISLAGEIAFATLEVGWRHLVSVMTAAWNDFKGLFVEGWYDMLNSIKHIILYIGEFVLWSIGYILKGILDNAASVAKLVGADRLAGKMKGALKGTLLDPDTVGKRYNEAHETIDEKDAENKRERKKARDTDLDEALTEELGAANRLAGLIAKAHRDAAKKAGPSTLGHEEDHVGAGLNAALSATPALADRVKGTFHTAAIGQQLGIGDKRDKELEGINSTARNTAVLPELNRNVVELGNRLRIR